MIIIKPEQLLQIFIIKPEQLLLAPSSSPWPQWLIPKIIFTFFSSRNLFSNFKIAQLLKRIQIYFKLGLTVADEVRRYADIWITPSQNTTMTMEMIKARQKVLFLCDFKKILRGEKVLTESQVQALQGNVALVNSWKPWSRGWTHCCRCPSWTRLEIESHWSTIFETSQKIHVHHLDVIFLNLSPLRKALLLLGRGIQPVCPIAQSDKIGSRYNEAVASHILCSRFAGYVRLQHGCY